MSNLLESYRVLGVKVGADINDVTTSYRQLCRTHHPDISDDPGSEELMKQINIAYTVLREKFKSEAKFRDRQTYSRPVRRYPTATVTRQQTVDMQQQAAQAHRQKAEERAAVSADAEKEAYSVLHDYFIALNTFDYISAYNYLSSHDKGHITLESFISWRESVARLYPMREFKIAGGSSVAVVTWGDEKTFYARKFHIIITEDDYTDNAKLSGDIDKLVINENGKWGVFLGYRELNELTRTFDKRFETRKKENVEKRWEEYNSGLYPEYDMLNIAGMRKPVTQELYRQRRYGGSLTFAVISIKHNGTNNAGHEDLLRSAAKTISGALRETDIAAYAGDGVFTVMFVELGKKNADIIINRLTESIRQKAGSQLGSQAEIEYDYGTWSGNSFADIDTLNGILEKFDKKI